jgi:hypothetical protein
MLIEMIEPLTSDVIKEVEKARKAGKKNTKKKQDWEHKRPQQKGSHEEVLHGGV